MNMWYISYCCEHVIYKSLWWICGPFISGMNELWFLNYVKKAWCLKLRDWNDDLATCWKAWHWCPYEMMIITGIDMNLVHDGLKHCIWLNGVVTVYSSHWSTCITAARKRWYWSLNQSQYSPKYAGCYRLTGHLIDSAIEPYWWSVPSGPVTPILSTTPGSWDGRHDVNVKNLRLMLTWNRGKYKNISCATFLEKVYFSIDS